MNPWLLDTGPLVALLSSNDARHGWAVEQAKVAPTTVLTCDAVISEALFLLKRARINPDGLFGMAETGFLRSAFDFNRERGPVRELMRRRLPRPNGGNESRGGDLDPRYGFPGLPKTSTTDAFAGRARLRPDSAGRSQTLSPGLPQPGSRPTVTLPCSPA